MFLAIIENNDDRLKVEKLYNTYRATMLYTANSILHDQYLAEDTVHQSFLRIIKNLHKINENDPKKVKSFLVIICRRVSFDLYNERKRMLESTKYIDNVNEQIGNILESDDELPLDVIIREESLDILLYKIKSVHSDYADIFLLRHYHDLSIADIADLLRITQNNVTVRLHRAKNMLRKLMEEVATEYEKGRI